MRLDLDHRGPGVSAPVRSFGPPISMERRQPRRSSRFARLKCAIIRSQIAGIVVCAVDPHAIHAGGHEFAHQQIVGRRLARHRHHDADAAPVGSGSQKRVGVSSEQHLAGVFGKRSDLR